MGEYLQKGTSSIGVVIRYVELKEWMEDRKGMKKRGRVGKRSSKDLKHKLSVDKVEYRGATAPKQSK